MTVRLSASVRQSSRWEGISHSGTLCRDGERAQEMSEDFLDR